MKGSTLIYKTLSNNRGSSTLVIVCTIFVVLIISALIIDVGYFAVERFRLANSAEDAAVKGVDGLLKGKEEAFKLIREYAVKRVNDLNDLEIRIADNCNAVTVNMGRSYDYVFLKFLGFESKKIKASVTVKLSSIESFRGVKPFAVEKRNFVFDVPYILTASGAKGDREISYLPLEFNDIDFKSHIIFGFPKVLKAKDKVFGLQDKNEMVTKEGLDMLIEKCNHTPKCTFNHFVKDCSRLMVIPVVNKISERDPMQVEGFAAFWVEETLALDGKTQIKGRFVKQAVNSKVNDGVLNFGLSGVKVIR
ncbi:MAG: hypothetical protein N2645_01415 [Clostridia bacterium]|nr:hypothetical protein [Clostridia bacterium]